jgi:hypothetical protein
LGGGENLTLVDATTSSGNPNDMALATYALVNPTAGAGTVTVTHTSNDNAITTAVNYIGTETSSVAAATNFLEEDVNDAITNTTVFASAGTAGNCLYAAGCFKGGDGSGITVPTGFFELFDGASGASATADISGYACDELDGAPSACTWTWAATDENAGHYLEIVAASASITEEPLVGAILTDTTGTVPTRLVNHIQGPLVGSLLTDTTGTVPVRILNHVQTPGIATPSPQLAGATPTIGTSVSPGHTDPTLLLAGQAPSVLVGMTVPSGALALHSTQFVDVPAGILDIYHGLNNPQAVQSSPQVLVPKTDLHLVTFTGLNLNGQAPTVSVSGGGELEEPLVGSLVLDEQTPVRIVNHITTPLVGALVTTPPLSPVRLVNHIVQPTTGSLLTDTTGSEPVVFIQMLELPLVGALLIESAGDPARVVNFIRGPPVATPSLLLNSDAPSAEIDHFKTNATKALLLEGQQPQIFVGRLVQPTTGPLVLGVVGSNPSAEIDHFKTNATVALSFGSDLVTIGTSASPTLGSVVFGSDAVTVTITFASPTITPSIGSLSLSGLAGQINVANAGTAIKNPGAVTDVPSNYEQCDYTGFRQLPGSLKFTWNKYAVRKKSWESRHPQEFLQNPTSERKKGSKRPEQDDRFIEDIGEVKPEDL